ncbi:MAG TPA: N-acetylmuramoyl-L-alanine amidase [Bacteroidota bacterium]|nr:N-acetylmuramoyl-L-alanine amidase [Bacteroidota bacterium]
MKFFHHTGFVGFALLFIVLFRSPAQQKKVFIKTGQQPAVAVAAIDSDGVVYVSMNDAATTLALPSGRSDIYHKFEVRFFGQRIKFTARNPFIVITDVASNISTIYQSPQPVLWRDTLYYAPLSVFHNIFDKFNPTAAFTDTSAEVVDSAYVPPPMFDIAGIEVQKKLNGYLVTVLANRRLGDYESWLNDQGWFFLTVANAKADTDAIKKAQTYGAIRQILTFQSPTSVQLTFRVTPDVVPPVDIAVDSATNNLLISLRTNSKIVKAELDRKKKEILESQRKNLEENRNRYKLDVIVIDAGHGGKDPGTIGVTGVYEKNVTLGVALRLGALIEKNLKGVKVIYTRKTDKFVELYRRGQIANEQRGKLFISIHCNSMPKKPNKANGFEIYLLRPEKTERAIEIAQMENGVIKQEADYEKHYSKERLTAEDFIITTMAQNAYMRYSEKFAEIASDAMSKSLKIRNSGVYQAGFLVLVGASMPNVLVETGYLSNKKEEKFLASKKGQQKIAEALFAGIKNYKTVYERALKEGITSNMQPASNQ